RRQDRGVLDVALRSRLEIEHLDLEHAALGARGLLLVEQRAEQRIAVHAGERSPHVAAARIDQDGNLTVADQAELETAQHPLRKPRSNLTEADHTGARPGWLWRGSQKGIGSGGRTVTGAADGRALPIGRSGRGASAPRRTARRPAILMFPHGAFHAL